MFDNKWQSVSFILGVVFLLMSLAFIVLVGFDYPVFLLATFSGTAFFVTYAAKQSREFQLANQLTSLIQREQQTLLVCKQHLSPSSLNEPVSFEIANITRLTVRDEHLSIILEGDLPGHDFKMTGQATEIKQHLKSVLTKEELQHITLG